MGPLHRPLRTGRHLAYLGRSRSVELLDGCVEEKGRGERVSASTGDKMALKEGRRKKGGRYKNTGPLLSLVRLPRSSGSIIVVACQTAEPVHPPARFTPSHKAGRGGRRRPLHRPLRLAAFDRRGAPSFLRRAPVSLFSPSSCHRTGNDVSGENHGVGWRLVVGGR